MTNQNATTYFVDRHLESVRRDRSAILYGGGRISFGQLAASVNRAGSFLRRIGVRAEQRVVLLLNDSPELVYFFFAALKIGAVAVPVNTFCKGELLTYYLNDTRAPVLITQRMFGGLITSASMEAVPFLERVAYIEDAEWLDDSAELQPFPVCEDDSAFWLYTSGSTGTQKAVIHRHGGMASCADNYGRDVLEISENDRCYSTSKLFFAYGLGNSIIFPLSVGATCILHEGRNDPVAVVGVIEQFRPTLFFSVPALYEQLLAIDDVNQQLFAGVRMCVSAGEYLPETIFDAWQERTGKIAYDGIGSTEAMHIFCSNRVGAHKRGTSGTPVDGYDIRVVDERGLPLPPTEIGRLQVRGKSLGKGYWNKREVSQRFFQGEWLTTGDVYQQTEDGYFKYIGRQDDSFKSSGLWVSSAEIEQVLLTHPSVKEASVIAVKNAAGRTVAKAFIVTQRPWLAHGDAALREDVHAYLKQRLPRYKIPKFIEMIPFLPRTATGKIARAELHVVKCEESGVSAGA